MRFASSPHPLRFDRLSLSHTVSLPSPHSSQLLQMLFVFALSVSENFLFQNLSLDPSTPFSFQHFRFYFRSCNKTFIQLYQRRFDNYILVSDITGGNYRKSIICLFETFWGIGVILLPLVAHLFPSWTSIYLAISLPTTAYLLIWPWIPDSPRWHIQRNNTAHVKQILLNAAKVNERMYLVPRNLDYRISVQAAMSLKVVETARWFSLWPNRKTILTMVMLHTAWAIYVTNYNGMLLNIRAFGREFLTPNTIAAGFSEIFGVCLALLFVLKTPKNKWYWTGIFNIVTGILTCFGFFIPETRKWFSFVIYRKFRMQFIHYSLQQSIWIGPESVYVILGMTLAMLSKMATTCSQTVLVASTGELVSPAQRKICIFSCVVWARIWLLTAPFIGAITFIHNLLPLAAFGVLGSIGGICTCIINYQLKRPAIVDEGKMSTQSSPHPEIYVINNSAWWWHSATHVSFASRESYRLIYLIYVLFFQVFVTHRCSAKL